MIQDNIHHTIDAAKIEAAKALIDSHQKFAILTHMSADGDAVGSSLAMAHYLQLKGKEARVIFNDTPGENLLFIPGTGFDRETGLEQGPFYVYDNQRDGTIDHKAEAIKTLQEAEVLVCTDFNVLSRTGELKNEVAKLSTPRLLIDHHIGPNEDEFDIIISHPEAVAACELIYRFILQMGDDALLDNTLATRLYCGLLTDTGIFTYNCNQSEIFLIAARLMQEGVDNEKIRREMALVHERRLRLMGYVLQQKMTIVPEHHAAFISLSKAELKRFNHQKGDSEYFVNLPLDIYGIRVTAFFREEKNIIKVSLRSKGDYPVNLLASKFFSGGGHKNAAGGEFLGSLAQAEQLFVKALPLFS